MTRSLMALGPLSILTMLSGGAALAEDSAPAIGGPTASEAQRAENAPNTNLPPAALPSPQYAPSMPAERPPMVDATGDPPPVRALGIGYKIGNGLGFMGGDIVINPVEHLSIDLQANYASLSTNRGTATGFGFAPGLQGHFRAGQRSGPYVGAAFIYLKMELDGDSVSVAAMAFNAGWEWKWTSGLGIILGGGIGHITSVSANTGIEYNGKRTMFNLESGIRYMFQ